MSDKFFEQVCGVWPAFTGGEAFEVSGPASVLGKVMEVCELEGMTRLNLDRGHANTKFPDARGPVRYDPFYLRAGAVYRVLLHLKMDRLPRDLAMSVSLWKPLCKGMTLLSTETDAVDGSVYMYVMPVFRTEVVRGFPLAEVTFAAKDVDIPEPVSAVRDYTPSPVPQGKPAPFDPGFVPANAELEVVKVGDGQLAHESAHDSGDNFEGRESDAFLEADL